ncbi:Calcium-transporting ATPase [compost metagenome]
MTFTVLTLTQMGHVLAIRSETQSLFTQGLRSNILLLGAVLLTFALQMGTLYIPVLNPIFRTEPLTANELLICIGVSCSVFVYAEIGKWIQRFTIT